jgi:hypothetical protein
MTPTHPLQECFNECLQIHGFDYDCWFYTQAEWKARKEEYLCDAELIFALDNQLTSVLNYSPEIGYEDELQDLANGFGYYFEFGNHWNIGFYPLKPKPKLPNSSESYPKLLASPYWHATRKRIEKRSLNICEDCGKAKQNLDVHHCYYRYGRLPWQYPDATLLHLCSDCHQRRQRTELKFRGFMPSLRIEEIEILEKSLPNGIYWFPRKKLFQFIKSIDAKTESMEKQLKQLVPLVSHPEDRN